MNKSPLWIEYSGYPQWLNEKVRNGAWPVFKRLVELDCMRNSRPDIVEITVSDLAQQVGLKPDAVQRIIKGLSKKKIGKSFLPEHPDEPILFKFNIPLKPPRDRAEIEEALRQAGIPGPWSWRYLESEQLHEVDENLLQKIVDLYFNNLGLKMNTFILDELRLLSARFSYDRIKRVFELAQRRQIQSLGWVAKELYRREQRERKKEAQKERN